MITTHTINRYLTITTLPLFLACDLATSLRSLIFYFSEKAKDYLFVVFSLDNFATTVKTVWADVVTQVYFPSVGVSRQRRCCQ